MKPFLILLLCLAAAIAYETGVVQETVVPLTGETLDTAIKDSANPLWLLKFYAPWCGHCKRLAPVLEGAAPKLKNRMAIGTIDCTVEKDVCKTYGVRGYPTLKFSLDGEIHEWPGGRSERDFIDFANRMSGPAIGFAKSIEDVHEAATDGISFLAYDPAAVAGETLEEKTKSTEFLQVFSQVARKFQASGTFLLLDTSDTASDEEASAMAASYGKEGAFIAKIENGVPHKFYESAATVEGLQKWAKEENKPTVAMLGAHNFMKLSQLGKTFLIACVQPEGVDEARAALIEYASSNSKYLVSIIDGVQWRQFVSQFSITDMPQLLLVNIHSKDYWTNTTDYGLDVTKFLSDIESGKIQKRSAARSSAESILGKTYGLVMKFKPFSYIFIAVVVIAFFYSICRLCCCGKKKKKKGTDPATGKPGTIEEDDKKEEEPKKDK